MKVLKAVIFETGSFVHEIAQCAGAVSSVCVGVVSEFPHLNAVTAPPAAVGHLVRMWSNSSSLPCQV